MHQAMPGEMKIKHWQPAQFTLASERFSRSVPLRGHAVVILNQPLSNKELLVQICRGGSLWASTHTQ